LSDRSQLPDSLHQSGRIQFIDHLLLALLEQDMPPVGFNVPHTILMVTPGEAENVVTDIFEMVLEFASSEDCLADHLDLLTFVRGVGLVSTVGEAVVYSWVYLV
jgi:hypothetical protein